MSGFVDLHCHWIPAVDDGAADLAEADGILSGLARLGFEVVVGTPHIRPGLFDNSRSGLVTAFESARSALVDRSGLPRLELAAEHYFDDVVFSRLMEDDGLPYPGGKSLLLEFHDLDFSPSLGFRLADLHRRGFTPVVAHPERYPALGQCPEKLERLLDVGAVALLDVAALGGRYGRRPRQLAEKLLDRGLYFAACSDAHHPLDLAAVDAGIRRLRKTWGDEAVHTLLRDGPHGLLDGRVPA